MRTYALTDLEGHSAMSRRTISDYVAKGLLSGPSHRGRGARYPQRDLDALQMIPRLRTVMKGEYPNLDAVRNFMADLSPADLHRMARMSNERVFETEVRRLRIRNRVRTFLPTVPPERIDGVLDSLTPEQVRGVDRGQYQLGSILDMTALSNGTSGATAGNSQSASAQTGIGGRFGDTAFGLGLETNGTSSDAPVSRVPHLRAVPTRDGSVMVEAIDDPNSQWARFKTSNVEIRIDRDALRAESGTVGLPMMIRDLAQKIEEFLKATA
jgi:DNA-binding transcriptional MerR regulator